VLGMAHKKILILLNVDSTRIPGRDFQGRYNHSCKECQEYF